MSQAIGTMYKIAKVPMRLYYDSDRAAKRNTLQSGWVQQAGDYRIVNVMWTNSNGDWLQTKPASGGIALYAIKDITDSYTIGWVRDDDNVKKGVITSIPSSITTEDESFKVVFTKMPGSTYTLKMVTNGVTWGSYVNSDASIAWDSLSQTHVFNTANKAKIYSAMPNSVNATATVTLETTYQGKSLGTDTKTIQVSIPSSIKPSFASTPAATITGAVGGKNYVGLTSLKLTVPTINVPSGATITSTIIDIGGQRSGNLAVGGSFTRTFNSPGTIPVSVTSTDSRGRSAVYSTTYTVLEAKNISIDSFTAIRNGTTGIKITANGQYMTQIDGTPKFTITKSIRGANTWSSVATGNVTVSNGRYSIAVTQTSGFTATSAYDLRLVVSGTSTSATGTSVVGTEAVPISFGKHGSGVGTMFNNSNSASLQVGSGGVKSEGDIHSDKSISATSLQAGNATIQKSGTTSRTLQMTDTDITYNGKSLLDTGMQFDNPILEAGAWNDYGIASIDNVNTVGNDVLIKYGRATVSGTEFTVTFDTNGGSFTGTPIVIATAVSGRWEFAIPSVTTVTATNFKASSVNGANGQAISASHEINYIAIGRRA